ncbi:MAG: hypothetical protein K2N34_00930 [Lachnospiraceae bacterium]|nr:hypothetical protein [Lachnospiraceae bacterium]
MERYFDENLRNQRTIDVFFDASEGEVWNTFSPSMCERDYGEFSGTPYGTINEAVVEMKLDY